MIVFVSAHENPVKSSADRMIHLPPSAKLVYRVIETDGAQTQKDLIQKTTLPSRTVRYAISRLREADIISERFHFIDARQSLYGLKVASDRGV